jgi:excinuclease ABC subunit C
VPGSGAVDVVGVEGDGTDASAVVLVYRDGRLVDKREYHWEGLDAPVGPDFLSSFLGQYYDANPSMPERVELPFAPASREAVRAFLTQQRGAAVKVTTPQRGTRARVLELAMENAREAFRLRFRQARHEADRLAQAVSHRLGLTEPVRRIECFDISHTQGEAQVASVVVWEKGKVRKGEYRSFNVRAGKGADDPAAVAEAVERRYRRRLNEGAVLPDLVLVDGGPTQVAAAAHGLAEAAVTIPLAGLAKRHEEVFLAGEGEPLHLEPHDPVRLLLQLLRDEAHRFAVTRHRRRRRQRRLATELLSIPGVGPTRAKRLLQHFGSVDGVRRATREEIEGVVGPAVAARAWEALHAGVAAQR